MKTKIENEVFTIPMGGNKSSEMTLEFYVCETNELFPERDIKELGLVMYESDKEARNSEGWRQFDNDNDFTVQEIEKLIKYLQKVKKHIKAFNANSKPNICCNNCEYHNSEDKQCSDCHKNSNFIAKVDFSSVCP